jgi:RNA polymerase sigma-32 factor
LSEAELDALQLSSMVRENAGRFQKHLNAREKDILERRILSDQPVTLAKLGNRHGVSRERIRQVEKKYRPLSHLASGQAPGYRTATLRMR